MESTEFLCTLWSEIVEYNRDAEWLNKVKEKLRDTPRQNNVTGYSKNKTETTSTGVRERWISTYMNDRRTHCTHHERQEQRDRPIACVTLKWKLLTSIFSEETYGHLSSQKLLSNGQKRSGKNSRILKGQLLMDKTIPRNCRRRLTNLSIAWIYYRKAYDMLRHSYIFECARMVGVTQNVVTMIENNMADWKTVLASNHEVLGQ